MDKIDRDEAEALIARAIKSVVEKFVPSESEKLEILMDLINGDYTVEALRQDYKESITNA